jgi:hypothetical protein
VNLPRYYYTHSCNFVKFFSRWGNQEHFLS